jgi:hypothetical protein
MRRLAASAIGIAILAACSQDATAGRDDGPVASRSFQLSGFERVTLAGADEVRVTTGGDFTVRAEGPSATLEKLDLRVEDGELIVDRIKERRWGLNLDRGATVHVTMPRATAVRITGAGDMTLDRGSGDFSGAITGAGDLAVGSIYAERVRLDLAGTGDIAVAGSTRMLNASVSGAGSIRAVDLVAASGRVRLTGVGGIEARIDGPADVELSGVGSADLGPNSQCRVRRSGVGSVTCGNTQAADATLSAR